MAVVKADGYGHGAITVARAAVAAGAGWLGTTSVAEAAALRAARLAVPILTWLHPSGIDTEAAAATRVDVAVGSMDELGALLAQAASTVRVHLHVDTGMSRGGVPAGSGTNSSVSLGVVNRLGGSGSLVSWGIFRWQTGPIPRRTRRRLLVCTRRSGRSGQRGSTGS